MTVTTPITISEPIQRTTRQETTPVANGPAPTPRGVRTLAAVSNGLFGGRTATPVAEMQRVAQHVQQTSRVGRQAAA